VKDRLRSVAVIGAERRLQLSCMTRRTAKKKLVHYAASEVLRPAEGLATDASRQSCFFLPIARCCRHLARRCQCTHQQSKGDARSRGIFCVLAVEMSSLLGTRPRSVSPWRTQTHVIVCLPMSSPFFILFQSASFFDGPVPKVG